MIRWSRAPDKKRLDATRDAWIPPLSRKIIALFSRDPNDDNWLLNGAVLCPLLLFKNGELQSRSRDEYVDELYPELVLKEEPQKYDDAWLSLIEDDDDGSLMLVSRKIIDGIGCMMLEIVSELWLLETIDAWWRGDIGGSDLCQKGKMR